MRNLRTKSRPVSGATIAEFAPALFVLILLLFPLINLVGYQCSVASAALITRHCAEAASQSRDYPSALSAMQNRAQQDLASGFGRFAHLTPIGGYGNCGADLYTTVTDVNTQAAVTYGPDSAVPQPIDARKNVYEVEVKTLFNVTPFLNLSRFPFIGNVPMIGRSTRLNSVAFRAVEFPKGFSTAIATGLGAPGAGSPSVTGSLAPFLALASGAGLPPPGNVLGSGVGPAPVPSGGAGAGLPVWRDPQFFNQIAASGQTIVAQDVFIVPAASPWVSSGISISPGQKVWIDSRADGMWAMSTANRLTDANGGTTSNLLPKFKVFTGANNGALIGSQGTPPSGPTPSSPPSSAPNLFAADNTLINFPVTYPGTLSFMINDNTLNDNSGQQVVRIVVTQ